jgi:acetoin:2,6-dichlorophenolindophenol oxidoreductase subunit alpha
LTRFAYRGNGFDDFVGRALSFDRAFLLGQYESMLRIRRVEEALEREYPKDEIRNPIHLVIGQEATAVGACAALGRSDQIYCSHRTHGAYLAKGGDLDAMMAELYCRSNGCTGSRGGSMHLIDKSVGMAGTSAIVGGIVPIAAGAAMAARVRRTGAVSCAFFGEAANEEGVMWETVNFAELKKLPLVFFCENNYYSVCSPLHQRQPVHEMHKKAAGFGIATEAVDGTNVLKVYEATRRAVDRARAGEGPTYIEAFVYRWRSHQGAGEDSKAGYRNAEEIDEWRRAACPIATFESYLEREGILDEAMVERLERKIRLEIEKSIEHARTSPLPGREELETHVYAVDPSPR